MRVDGLIPLFTPDRIFVVTNAHMAAVLMARHAPELPGEDFIAWSHSRTSPHQLQGWQR